MSFPQEILGASAFGPKRWYSCVRGLPGSELTPQQDTKSGEAIGIWTGQSRGVFDTVLFFSGEGRRPSVSSGYDSLLCRDVAFQITSEPPII